jgi:hypothetical protein
MARTIQEIQAEIVAAKEAEPVLATLNSPSKTAVWRLWTYVTAVGIWTLEKLFDSHLTEVQEIIYRMKPHSLAWYAGKAREFEYGRDLPPDTDQYDHAGMTPEEVEAVRIVAHASVTEADHNLLVKVAREENGDLAPLSAQELVAFAGYMNRIKDAGVSLSIESRPADSLQLNLDIYYNPLTLDANGVRIDGTGSQPVKDAITAYLKNLPFNGVLVAAWLIDALQKVDGVLIPALRDGALWCRYGTFDFEQYPVMYQTDAGYIRIADDDLSIHYIARSAI